MPKTRILLPRLLALFVRQRLDIAWLRDTSNDPEDELIEPAEEIAAAIATHLGNALREIEKMMDEFTQDGGSS